MAHPHRAAGRSFKRCLSPAAREVVCVQVAFTPRSAHSFHLRLFIFFEPMNSPTCSPRWPMNTPRCKDVERSRRGCAGLSARPIVQTLSILVVAVSIRGAGSLHPRNAFQGSYDMSRLVSASPALRPHIIPAHLSKSGRATIDFADAAAVRALNAALLKADYNVQGWVLPPAKLCPPVPGRADYVHLIADTLSHSAGKNSQKTVFSDFIRYNTLWH